MASCEPCSDPEWKPGQPGVLSPGQLLFPDHCRNWQLPSELNSRAREAHLLERAVTQKYEFKFEQIYNQILLLTHELTTK